jgi:hypothetical protein
MHGIFVGEIQALEGAGRTCHDFETAIGPAKVGETDTVPFALKLDMARQAWDEARHVEISVSSATGWGSEIGQFAENTVLFSAACSNDAVLRLAGVNRALEGLAIDVFTQMKEFGDLAGDPYLEFCEDWMLADEVTHVKMGSDWLRASPRTIRSGARRRSSSSRRRQAVQLRRHAQRQRGVADRPRAPVPRARRLHRHRGRGDRRRQHGSAQRAREAGREDEGRGRTARGSLTSPHERPRTLRR